MTKIFALLAVLLILTGVVLLAVPREDEAAVRGFAPEAAARPAAALPLLVRARDIAEQVNAPLSILFGLVSLYYTRRTYQISRAHGDADKGGG